MSLYESLDRFVGAGLIAWGLACGWPGLSQATVARGETFSGFLRERGESGPFGAVLDTLAQEIWLSQDTRGIPHQVAEAHAVALAAMMVDVPPRPADVGAAIGEIKAGRRIDHLVSAMAADMMARVLSRPQAAGLRADVVLFLLERMATHLVVDPALMAGLRPAVEEFAALDGGARPVPVTQTAAPALSQLTPKPAGSTGNPPASMTAGDLQRLMPIAAPIQRASPPLPAPEQAPSPLVPTATLPPALPIAVSRPAAASELSGALALKAKYRLSDLAFQRFATLLEAQSLRPEQRLARLEELAVWLDQTVAQLSRASNDDAATRSLKEKAARALADGDFETAFELLKSLRRNVRENRRKTEQRLEEEMQILKAQMAEEAVATARLGELALARCDYDEAIDLFAEAVDGAPRADTDLEISYRLRYADALFRKGDDTRDAGSLAQAVRSYGTVADLALKIRSARPYAMARRGEGDALFRLAEAETATTNLRAAVAAWREALPHFSRPDEAIARGLLLIEIGAALATIAERERDATLFTESAQELRKALDLLPAADAPLDRATAELYLGRALVAQSEGSSDVKLLAEAVTLFTSATGAWHTAQMALQWAAAQLNLGAALVRIGEFEDRRRNWTSAASSFLQALDVFENEGVEQSAAQVREMVRQLHVRLDAEMDPAIAAMRRVTSA